MSIRSSLASSLALLLTAGAAIACSADSRTAGAATGDVAAAPEPAASAADSAATAPSDGAAATIAAAGTPSDQPPNELGKIPVFEYHLIGDKNATYERTKAGMRRDLELLYEKGFRPVSISDVLDKKLDLPRGYSPAVFVFDDASPSQFRYIERNGKLEIDPGSAVGIWLDFAKSKPDWKNKAVFCMLPAAQAGRSFFGDKGIEGQKCEWRFQKVRFLHEQGFELCNHTLYHARLDRAGDRVEEFIARGNMAIDSAVPGYKVRTFALPLGMWPKNRALAQKGSWKDPKSGKVVSYTNEAILEVAGGPTESPHDPKFNPLSIKRVEVIGDSAVTRTVRQLDRAGKRYVSDGDPRTVAKPVSTPVAAGQ